MRETQQQDLKVVPFNVRSMASRARCNHKRPAGASGSLPEEKARSYIINREQKGHQQQRQAGTQSINP
jgi:hypothetical protein